MKRVTENQLRTMAANLNRMCPFSDGSKYEIEFAYGGPRLGRAMAGKPGCFADVSPRLPKGELANWIWAFQAGIERRTDELKEGAK